MPPVSFAGTAPARLICAAGRSGDLPYNHDYTRLHSRLTSSIPSPIHRMTGTAIELPKAL